VSRAALLADRPAQTPLPDPRLRAKLKKGRRGAAVEVTAQNLALGVCLEAEGAAGRFEDNFFDLLPGEKRTVKFLADGALGAKALKDLASRLRVVSLFEARR
jgi:beta-mannosidase